MKYIPDADVSIHKVRQPSKKQVHLWGDPYWVYDDDWRTHLHVVCTHKCNADCWFCIEKESPKTEIGLIERLSYVCSEMRDADILKTVSFTGGEPTLCSDLAKLVECVGTDVFKTINTNGRDIKTAMNIGLDWVNLSRHSVCDEANNNIVGFSAPTVKELIARDKTETKLRIQAVVNQKTKISDFIELVRVGACDDLSFRSLMIDGTQRSQRMHAVYQQLISDLLEVGSKVIEQEIQDYYVYEIHEYCGATITFSYSDMQTLHDDEKLESNNFVKEFILRPDGGVYNSWSIGNRCILEPPE